VGAEAPQAPLHRRDECLAGGAGIVGPGTHGERGLGGHQDPIPATGDRHAEDLFGLAGRIHVGGIEAVQARVEADIDQPLRSGGLSGTPLLEKVAHSAEGGDALTYLHGHGNLVAGLERALDGKNAGDKLHVKVEPADGYGEYDKALVQKIPRRTLKGISNLKVGMRLHAQTEHGARAVTVTQILGDMVTLDANHPLAGQALNFDIE